MNPFLAYYIVHSPSVSGPIALLVNFIVYLIIAIILFYLVKLAAAEFNVSANIVKLIGLLIFLFLILALFVGCSTCYYPNGGKACVVGSNVAHFAMTSGNYNVTMDGVDNAVIHNAAGNTVTKTGAAVATSGLLGIFH